MISRLAVIAGSGDYPRLLVEGAKRAGVAEVEVAGVLGSVERATLKAADRVSSISLGRIPEGLRRVAAGKFDGVVFAGQVNPLSLFRGGFDAETRGWLKELKVKSAHSLFRKIIEVVEADGLKVLPASLFMDQQLPGEGCLTERGFTTDEANDVDRALQVAHDVGVHDVGQTVMVKSGMVLAVEAFEGTNAAIRRGGKLGGAGAVVAKVAREGHDMRFDIPVVGLKTLKTMHRAGATALAFEAGRLILLEREKVLKFANAHAIAIVGVKSALPAFPTRID